ncbi:type II toxin-antitoxin system VapC family toxin [Pseudomonadota bacterium]
MNRDKKKSALLDSNVFIYLFRNERNLERLFSPKILSKVKYVISPIVLQELLLAGDSFIPRDKLEEISEQFEVVPVDVIKSEALLKNVRKLRNRVAHSNDLMILGSAQNCDYLVSYDKLLARFGEELNIPVVTPDEFLNEVLK